MSTVLPSFVNDWVRVQPTVTTTPPPPPLTGASLGVTTFLSVLSYNQITVIESRWEKKTDVINQNVLNRLFRKVHYHNHHQSSGHHHRRRRHHHHNRHCHHHHRRRCCLLLLLLRHICYLEFDMNEKWKRRFCAFLGLNDFLTTQIETCECRVNFKWTA